MALSAKRSVLPRCPFQSVHACPRYYESLSLLQSTGATAISKDEDARLKTAWEKSDLWPRLTEQSSSVGSWGGKLGDISNFCPEVAFLRFGYFAKYLSRYTDELDKDQAHQRLHAEDVPADDLRWTWGSAEPSHYTECPLYSVLAYRNGDPANFIASSTVPGSFDVFVSHASEDKEDFAKPLANALKAKGLKVWFDEFELTFGSSLRRSIDKGLAQSRFGIVILSPSFFLKSWPQQELDGLSALEIGGRSRVIPVRHNLTHDQLLAKSPMLADKYAADSAKNSITEIADKILTLVRSAEGK